MPMLASPWHVPSPSRRWLLRMAGSAAASAILPSFFTAASRAAEGLGPLSWAPPALDNPLHLKIGSDDSNKVIDLAPDTDYLIAIGSDSGGMVTRRALSFKGGRHIVIIGGHVRRAPETPASDEAGKRAPVPSALFRISGHSGIAYVEGVLFDANGQYGVDAINVCGDNGGTTIFQNVHVRNVTGTKMGNHADGLQIVNPTRMLLIDRMTIYSGYQGFQIQPEFPIGLVWLRNCNARYPDPDKNHGQANGYALWLGLNGNGDHSKHHYKFDNVYIEERRNVFNMPWQEASIAPAASWPGGARLAPGHDDQAVFPTMNVEGHVSRGIPPGGDFCPADRLVDASGRVIYTPAAEWLRLS